MKNQLTLSVALLLGLVSAEINQEYINDKREQLAETTCYIYGDLSVFDLRSLSAREDNNDNPDYSTSLPSGDTLVFNYCQFTQELCNNQLVYAYIKKKDDGTLVCLTDDDINTFKGTVQKDQSGDNVESLTFINDDGTKTADGQYSFKTTIQCQADITTDPTTFTVD